jgi:hypothetical protein
MSFSILLVGPSKFLHIPDKIVIIFIGMFLVGFFAAFMFVPIIPELIETLEE